MASFFERDDKSYWPRLIEDDLVVLGDLYVDKEFVINGDLVLDGILTTENIDIRGWIKADKFIEAGEYLKGEQLFVTNEAIISNISISNGRSNSSNIAIGTESVNLSGSNNLVVGSMPAMNIDGDEQIFISAGNTKIISSTGEPEGVHTAGVGSIYSQIDGNGTSTVYIKVSGEDSYGWEPLDGAIPDISMAVMKAGDTMSGPLIVDNSVEISQFNEGDIEGFKIQYGHRFIGSSNGEPHGITSEVGSLYLQNDGIDGSVLWIREPSGWIVPHKAEIDDLLFRVKELEINKGREYRYTVLEHSMEPANDKGDVIINTQEAKSINYISLAPLDNNSSPPQSVSVGDTIELVDVNARVRKVINKGVIESTAGPTFNRYIITECNSSNAMRVEWSEGEFDIPVGNTLGIYVYQDVKQESTGDFVLRPRNTDLYDKPLVYNEDPSAGDGFFEPLQDYLKLYVTKTEFNSSQKTQDNKTDDLKNRVEILEDLHGQAPEVPEGHEPIFAEDEPTEYPSEPPEELQVGDQWYEVTDPSFDYDDPDIEGLDLYIWDGSNWGLYEEPPEFVKVEGDTMKGDLVMDKAKVKTLFLDSGENSNLAIQHDGNTKVYVGNTQSSFIHHIKLNKRRYR